MDQGLQPNQLAISLPIASVYENLTNTLGYEMREPRRVVKVYAGKKRRVLYASWMKSVPLEAIEAVSSSLARHVYMGARRQYGDEYPRVHLLLKEARLQPDSQVALVLELHVDRAPHKADCFPDSRIWWEEEKARILKASVGYAGQLDP